MTLDPERIGQMTDEQWRGYITRAIEGIDSELKEINRKQDACNRTISAIKTKTATISGTVAVVVSVLGILLGNFIKHLMGK